jgi:Na+/H+ antiporter NhaD/arsenite permease-like protein
MLFAAVTFSSGLFSAFLLNDAICLVMTPLVADIAMRAAARSGALPLGRRDGLECR